MFALRFLPCRWRVEYPTAITTDTISCDWEYALRLENKKKPEFNRQEDAKRIQIFKIGIFANTLCNTKMSAMWIT